MDEYGKMKSVINRIARAHAEYVAPTEKLMLGFVL